MCVEILLGFLDSWLFVYSIHFLLTFLCHKINQDCCSAHLKEQLKDDGQMLDLKGKIN